MAKNPIFPLYYNDILGSTKTWTDEEFGAYMRLLIEQWDNDFIPNPYQTSTKELPPDFQRLSRIATSAEKNWPLLSTKFTETEHGLQNQNLERIRDLKRKHSEKQKENIQKRYQTSTKLSTKNLPLEDENEIEKIFKQIIEVLNIEIPENEKNITTMLVLKMFQEFLKENPDYFHHQETDYAACLQIAYNIAKTKKWSKHDVVNGKMNDCLSSWQNIIQYIKNDKWFSGRSLTDLSSIKEWQRLTQQMSKTTTNGNTKNRSSNSADGKEAPTDTLYS